MTDKGGPYGSKASDTDFRKKWDKEAYAEKAKKKDEEERERMKENEERMKQGKKPRKGHKDNLPKPTELMKAREGPLELERNLGKTMVVQNPSARGPGQPGFYCEACNRTYKDTIGYLDHINSRAHLRAIGQSTRMERSTLAEVQERISYLREKTKEASSAKAFDFDQRLAEVKARELALREQRKTEKKALRERARLEYLKDVNMEANNEMEMMMGFAGFGSTKK